MNSQTMQKMIESGVLKHADEPSFFQEPTGYDLSTPTTTYNTTLLNSNLRSGIDFNAKLEPGTG